MSSRSQSPAGASVSAGAISTRRSSEQSTAKRASVVTVVATVACAALPLATIAVLAWPMLLTESSLGGDWLHHLWYVWHQSLALRADGAPSPFLNTSYSVLYPEYMFYGGTIYALTGALALALGDSSIAAYVITYVLGFAAAYGGLYWAGRMAGLGRWAAQAPALLFVTSACYLTLVYGQGDWPEFLAMSMLPLMVTAGVSVLRAERLRVGPFLALAGSCVVFFGSHDLTMLWGCSLLAVTGALVLAFVPRSRAWLRPRRLGRVAAVVAPAALVNAWFLLPALAYASNTKIGSQYAVADHTLRYTMGLVSFAHIFTLSRATTIPGLPDYVLVLPTLAILWVLVGAAVVLRNGARRATGARALLVACGASGAIVVLMTHVGLVLALPHPYDMLQFNYRLESYVAMGVSAAALAILSMARETPGMLRRYAWTILPIVVVSLVGAVQQVDAYPRTQAPRWATFTPGSEVFAETFDDYGYAPLPLIQGERLPVLRASPAAIHDNRLAATVRMRPGQLVYTNIGGGPDLLRISGARVVGRDAGYHLVLAIGPPSATPSAHPRTALAADRIAIAPADPPPVALGRLLSVAAVAVLALELAWLLCGSWRRRRRRPGCATP